MCLLCGGQLIVVGASAVGNETVVIVGPFTTMVAVKPV